MPFKFHDLFRALDKLNDANKAFENYLKQRGELHGEDLIIHKYGEKPPFSVKPKQNSK